MNFPYKIKAVIGLGNPGAEYKNTRHNIGFKVIDTLVENIFKKQDFSNQYNALFMSRQIAGRKVGFLKPLTYMNLSGNSIHTFCRKENVLPEELLIVYDDMYLPIGKIRFRVGGSSAGHNGIESIISKLQSNKFCRLKIGIGKDSNISMPDYVLNDFNIEETIIIEKLLDLSVEAIKLSLHRDVFIAMNKFNGNELITKTKENEGV
ncbi:MAG: aminoacyl-tRNA hydrolase [bacterium]|nr:aminoacyl-tRNA hydrolase [bacterium]